MASAPPQAHNLQPPPLSRDGKRWTRRKRGPRGLVVDLRAVPNVNHNDDNTRVHNVSKPDLLAVNALPRNLGSSRAPTSRRNLLALQLTQRHSSQLPTTNLSSLLLQAIHILQISQMCTQRFPKIKRTRPPRTSRQLIQTPLLLVIDTQANHRTTHVNMLTGYTGKNQGLATATQAADEPPQSEGQSTRTTT
ncbi:hypothetical protein FRC0505_00035 [Corynebacterium diphtheriae]|nr:hypothetical protein FRC0032_00081 [Corynebacterium diphtheriae]CAB0690983.1 hypothetical protein FRC0024_00968 [Corynebacterium diphtheriae]CAB0731133.1 hypothetical protein FRC0119_00149 [Corynebacterium diphtheriae]CAB0797063.1 hypothetical protein FRC0292_00081 [Corynebacterium diphtheriae]CAB0829470.1 hypothetical protein FRC0314_00034 [Corynebacterium diphtheriae]